MEKEKLKYNLILFLISPMAALIPVVGGSGHRKNCLIVVLFFLVFGSTMIFSEGTDGFRHSENIENHYSQLSLSDFLKESKDIFLFKPSEKINDDIYIHFISYVASFFSSGSTALYGIAGLVYGYFFFIGVNKVFSITKNGRSYVVLLLLIVFVFWKSLDGLNSIRNHTGAWILFNGVFSYFQTKKIKYVFLVFLSPLVHFGYLIISLPFFIVTLMGNRNISFFIIYILSFFLSFNLNVIQEYSGHTQLGQTKYKQYVRSNEFFDEKKEVIRSESSFHKAYYFKGIKYFIIIIFLYSLLTSGFVYHKKGMNLPFYLANMSLLILAFANFSDFALSLEKRFYINSGFYIIPCVIILYINSISKNVFARSVFHLIVILGLPVCALFIFTQMSLIGEFMDLKVFMSPVTYLFITEDISIKEFLKELL